MKVTLLLLVVVVLSCGSSFVYATKTTTTIEFAVEVTDESLPIEGFEIVRRVPNLKNIFVVRPSSSSPSVESNSVGALLSSLQSNPNVKWTEQQIPKRLYKRNNALPDFQDPLFLDQWHLINTGQQNGTSGSDIDVKGAWEMVMISLFDGTIIKHHIQNGTAVDVAIYNSTLKLPVDSYEGWRFSTVRNWGEYSDGVWTLKVADEYVEDVGVFHTWTMNIYGAATTPGVAPSDTSGVATKWVVLGAVLEAVFVAGLVLVGAIIYFRRRQGYARIDEYVDTLK